MDGEVEAAVVAGRAGGPAHQGRDRRRGGGRGPGHASASGGRAGIAAPERAVDTCGTGGDGADTVNISTAAAVVAAAAGVRGRQARQPLGVVPLRLGRRARGCGRAPRSRAGAHGRAARRSGHRLPLRAAAAPGHGGGDAGAAGPSAVRTVFNLLGPLTNPAGVERQVIGVWGAEVQALMASALAELGAAARSGRPLRRRAGRNLGQCADDGHRGAKRESGR